MKALISVSDKTGVVELARQLYELGVEILSTGGTYAALNKAEVPATEVGQFTGFPEILDGRVKTLHPKIFGGILSLRQNAAHQTQSRQHAIEMIDWVIVNLYPFEQVVSENKVAKSEMIEFIDIGGVSLLRAAGKNFSDVVVLSDPKDYDAVLQEFKQNKTVSAHTRKRLAGKAFAHTAHYDSMITNFFNHNETIVSSAEKPVVSSQAQNTFAQELTLPLRKVADLRYGENPQQKAALYQNSGQAQQGVVGAQQLQGKELSFNNYLDLDSAWTLANSIANSSLQKQEHICVIVKHTNPCGVAKAQTASTAFALALSRDALSAFGGIIAFSGLVDEACANLITQHFFECVIAPDYTPGSLEIFKKKTNLRLLRQKTFLTNPYELDIKRISGGALVQQQDWSIEESANCKVVSKRLPSPQEIYSLDFAWKICKHVKSNAIVLARGALSYGVGAGQMSRIDSLKAALVKMKEVQTINPDSSNKDVSAILTQTQQLPLVLASDAFFPFRDCVDLSVAAGVQAIIQPGGSIRDADSIAAADEHGITLLFTGVRHFKH